MDKIALVIGIIFGGGAVALAWLTYNIGYVQGIDKAQEECDEHEAIGNLIFGDNNNDITEYPHGPLVP